VSNREGFEHKAFASGRMTGDLAWPLPFAPEFFQDEFKSVVADMKNNVKDRSNAQSSCAAQFVYEHIKDLNIPWLHIDVAGPSHRTERGTGYGVGLISDLVANLKAADLKK
jgi:probable aminopeptidase NPEPL1